MSRIIVNQDNDKLAVYNKLSFLFLIPVTINLVIFVSIVYLCYFENKVMPFKNAFFYIFTSLILFFLLLETYRLLIMHIFPNEVILQKLQNDFISLNKNKFHCSEFKSIEICEQISTNNYLDYHIFIKTKSNKRFLLLLYIDGSQLEKVKTLFTDFLNISEIEMKRKWLAVNWTDVNLKQKKS